MANLFIAISVFAMCLLLITLVLLMYGDGSEEQKLMSYFVCGSLVQNAGYLLELTAPTMDAALVSVKMQYLGSLFIPLCYCNFIFDYCYERAPKRFFQILGMIDACLLALVFTCDRQTLYYRGMDWLETADGHHYLSLHYGPAYYVFMLCGCIIPYTMSIVTLLRTVYTKSGHMTNKRYEFIIGMSCLPIAALLAYAGKLTDVFDLTPSVLGLVLSVVVILVWSRRNYDFGRLAAEVVLDSMGDGVIALDDQKRVVSVNQAASGIFSDVVSIRIGDSIRDINVFPDDILNEDLKKEFCFNGKYYESHVKQIPGRNGLNQGYVILILDVTETRNYIEEIKRVREQAEQANMAKSEFLANMSHEIRTPMNAIVGLSDIIMEESRGRKVYSYACDIQSASQNLLAIINDILDLSKVEAGKMELVLDDYYIKAVVGEVVNMLDIAASQHGLLMKCEYDDSIPCQYYGDEGRIKQILINILNNAVKFTKQGYVKITISGRPADSDSDPEKNTELVTFRVEDTGCGIRQEDLGKIFENFGQVDSKRNRSVEGTGLGLSITRHLVGLMNGTIDVESVYGEGTTFTVTIPQRIVDSRTLREVPGVPGREEPEIEPFTVNGYKVLVVDDNLINRKVAIGFLKSYGFDITEADSGQEAIGLVKQTRFDIIFMDHMMPEMDGIEAVHIIREECGENGRYPVIIALTANAMEGVRERFLNCGFQDFITKPLERKPLDKILVRWIPDKCRTMQQAGDAADRTESGAGSESGFGDIQIRGIQVKEAEKFHSGSVENYIGLLELYCLDGRRKLGLLRELLEKNDYKTYEVEVHGLKSASANIGAMELSAQAREHEEAAGKLDTDFISLHFTELYQSYEAQLKYIQEFLDSQKTAEDLPPEGGGIDRDVLAQEARAALDSLEHFRSRECAEKIGHLLKYRLDDEAGAKLREIQEQLKMYEDDAAETLLNRFLVWLDREDTPDE